jgi:hypothetical protein
MIKNENHKKFDDLLLLCIKKYYIFKNNKVKYEKYIYILVIEMKNIYENTDDFKTIFENYYCDDKSPFITAYRQFTNYILNSEHSIDESYYIICRDIIYRKILEMKNNNELVCF